MPKRESFVLYTDTAQHIQRLSLEQRGQLLTAIFALASDEEFPKLDPVTDMAFSFIEAQLKRDWLKWDAKREKRAQAGSQGGKASAAARKQKSAIVSNASFACDDEANEAVPVSVSAPASVPVSASVPDLQERFSPLVAGCISEWLAYKKERREAYKPTGLKSLLTEIENRVKQHGEQAVCDVIRLTMSNGWRGIVWDKIDREGGKANATSEIHQSEPETQRDYPP